MSRKHKKDEVLCPIYGKAIQESYCLEECLINDCGYLVTSGDEVKMRVQAFNNAADSASGTSLP